VTQRKTAPRLRVCPSPCPVSFRFFMVGVLAATTTVLTKLQPIWRSFLIFSRNVIAVLALVTLQHNIISRHISFPIGDCRLIRCLYSITSEIVPAPTVRPPSRIANRSPFSIAIGVINSTSIATLSPGITISTPAGKCATPVTSVVRK